MSSHREAPQIATDPVADNTDTYAFVSPDKPDTVTLISNYIPLQLPDGGPNFFQFGDDVLYEIHVDNTGDGTPNISYQFNFSSTQNTSNFLYNDGPITSLDSASWLAKQTYSLTVVKYSSYPTVSSSTVVATDLPCPPCNIGPLSTPDYATLGHSAVQSPTGGGFTGQVFAGQRQEGFFVDLGAIFDLGNLRPFQADHNMFGLKDTGLAKMSAGVNSTNNLNVHSIAIQVPITDVTNGGTTPSSTTASNAVIGVWASASRTASLVRNGDGTFTSTGGYVQVSRLAQPLINEVLIPMSMKDKWNGSAPSGDSQFAQYYSNPALAQLLPTLYPGVFPNLAKYNAGTGSAAPDRADLVAILLTGIPKGVVAATYTTQIGSSTTQADMIRLNVAIPPATKPNNLGVLGGDIAGFPNGRRVFDDVVTIELRALAGATLPLVDTSYKADAAASEISEGLAKSGTDRTAMGKEDYEPHFPYLGEPRSGYDLNELTLVPNRTGASY